MNDALTWIAFGLGAWLSVTSVYLSLLRFPLHRLRGRSKGSYRYVSGIPLLGSLLVAVSLLRLHGVNWVLPIGLVLIAVDSGGIHWFAGTMLYLWLRPPKA